MIAIITPTSFEQKCVLPLIDQKQNKNIESVKCVFGKINDKKVVSCVSKMGENCQKVVQELIDELDLDKIILLGYAGAICEEAKVGDIYIGSENFVTSRVIVETPAQKKALFEKTKKPAVEMEGAFIENLAKKDFIDFAHIRAISDACDHHLPTDLTLACFDKNENFAPFKLICHLIFHPKNIKHLFIISRNLSKAKKPLQNALIENI